MSSSKPCGAMVEIKVEAQKGNAHYTEVCSKFFENGLGPADKDGYPTEASGASSALQAVDEIRITGEGDAVGVAIAVATAVESSGLGQVVKVDTDYPQMQGGKISDMAVLIQVMRVGRFSTRALASGLPAALQRVALARASPKVELHVHLDGSFVLKTLYAAAKKYRDQLPEKRVCPWEDPDTKTNPIVYPQSELGDSKSIDEFKRMVTSKAEKGLLPLIEVFYRYLPVVMGRHELLEELAYRFCEFQKNNNVVYSELRYSPHEFFEEEHKEKPPDGMARAVVESISKGLARGQQEHGIVVKQILCCINFAPHWSMDVVKTAVASRDLGVVGVDVASGENHFDIEAIHQGHTAAMDFAHEQGMPITIHAGEDGPAANCVTAVDAYHAKRLGHGYHLLEDEAAYKRLRELGIHCECCPTSSIMTKAVTGEDGWAKHPICEFLKDGMSVSIATDDPMVFDTDLRGEIDICIAKMGLTLDDIKTCTNNAINAAFCDDAQKEVIRQRVESWYQGVSAS